MSITDILAEMKSDSLQYLAVLSLNRISISGPATQREFILDWRTSGPDGTANLIFGSIFYSYFSQISAAFS